MAKLKQSKTDLVIKQIKDFYAIGEASLQKYRGRAKYGKHQRDHEGKQWKMNPYTLRKARQFADPDRGYSREEFKELCLEVHAQSVLSQGETTFGRTHIVRLIGVPKSKRLELQHLAITNGWSTSELSNQIVMRFGRRRLGGRRPRICSDLHLLYGQIESLCRRWQRWSTDLAVHHKNGSIAKIPEDINALIGKTTNCIQELQTSVTKKLNKKWLKRILVEKVT